MRLFIFLSFSNINNVLLDLQKQLRGDLKKVKEFHLTLKFLGDVEKVDEVKEALRKISFEPFELSLDKIGGFPTSQNPRTIWAGVKPDDQVIKLQKKIEEALEPLGFEKDKRFHSHITLARVKRDGEIVSDEVTETNTRITRFGLMKSTLTPEGPVYEVLEEY